MNNIENLVGIGASIFTGIALLPQLVKVIKEKNADGVSPLMLIALFVGLVFWVIYGFYKNDWIIIISNAFSLLVNITIASLALYYSRFRKS